MPGQCTIVLRLTRPWLAAYRVARALRCRSMQRWLHRHPRFRVV